MKNVEKVLAALLLISMILKIFSIPGGDFLVCISLIFSSAFYFFFTFPLLNNLTVRQLFYRESFEVITSLHALYSLFCSFAFYSFSMGLCFYIFNWPNRLLLFWFGIVLFVICLIISTVKYINSRSIFYKAILIRIIIFAFFFGLYLAINFTKGW
jgi:hypothetical protein